MEDRDKDHILIYTWAECRCLHYILYQSTQQPEFLGKETRLPDTLHGLRWRFSIQNSYRCINTERSQFETGIWSDYSLNVSQLIGRQKHLRSLRWDPQTKNNIKQLNHTEEVSHESHLDQHQLQEKWFYRRTTSVRNQRQRTSSIHINIINSEWSCLIIKWPSMERVTAEDLPDDSM